MRITGKIERHLVSVIGFPTSRFAYVMIVADPSRGCQQQAQFPYIYAETGVLFEARALLS
jgi:hypothetical protein